jgi:hypothetical protein
MNTQEDYRRDIEDVRDRLDNIHNDVTALEDNICYVRGSISTTFEALRDVADALRKMGDSIQTVATAVVGLGDVLKTVEQARAAQPSPFDSFSAFFAPDNAASGDKAYASALAKQNKSKPKKTPGKVVPLKPVPPNG